MNRVRWVLRPKIVDDLVYPDQCTRVLQECFELWTVNGETTYEWRSTYEWRDVPCVTEEEPK